LTNNKILNQQEKIENPKISNTPKPNPNSNPNSNSTSNPISNPNLNPNPNPSPSPNPVRKIRRSPIRISAISEFNNLSKKSGLLLKSSSDKKKERKALQRESTRDTEITYANLTLTLNLNLTPTLTLTLALPLIRSPRIMVPHGTVENAHARTHTNKNKYDAYGTFKVPRIRKIVEKEPEITFRRESRIGPEYQIDLKDIAGVGEFVGITYESDTNDDNDGSNSDKNDKNNNQNDNLDNLNSNNSNDNDNECSK
jgi:hypothetical protein